MRQRGRVLAATFLGAAIVAPTTAQEAPSCAANSYEPRTAAQVMADVARHRCPPGSRLDAAMTIAGQAIVLQTSGLCEAGTVRTRTRRSPSDASVLALTCILAAR